MSIFTFTQATLQQENNDHCCKQWLYRDVQGEHQLVTLDAPCVVVDITEPVSCELSLMIGSKVRTLLIRSVVTDSTGVDVLISRTLTYVAISGQIVRFEYRDNGAILCYLGQTKKCRLLIPPNTPINFIIHNCILDVSERLYLQHFNRVSSCFPKMRMTDLFVCYDCVRDQCCALDFCSAPDVYVTLRKHCCSKHEATLIPDGHERNFLVHKVGQRVSF